MDVQNTVTHEAGHFIGLAHDNDHPEATMYLSAQPCEVSKRDLAQTDVAGVCTIYPAGKATVTCASSSSGCGCHSAGPEGLLGAAAVLLLRRRHSGNKSPRAEAQPAEAAPEREGGTGGRSGTGPATEEGARA